MSSVRPNGRPTSETVRGRCERKCRTFVMEKGKKPNSRKEAIIQRHGLREDGKPPRALALDKRLNRREDGKPPRLRVIKGKGRGSKTYGCKPEEIQAMPRAPPLLPILGGRAEQQADRV